MSAHDRWAARLQTGRAIGLLCLARLLIALVPFGLWRRGLGPGANARPQPETAEIRRLAAHISRAAWRLPFAAKCLPQAMALSWQLRRRAIAHRIVFAVRPPGHRSGDDMLHAWIECQGEIVLGELPGPWLTVLALPSH